MANIYSRKEKVKLFPFFIIKNLKASDILIKIRKDQAEFLRNNGCAEQVKMCSTTHKQRGKTYYCVTSDKALTTLENYNNMIVQKN